MSPAPGVPPTSVAFFFPLFVWKKIISLCPFLNRMAPVVPKTILQVTRKKKQSPLFPSANYIPASISFSPA